MSANHNSVTITQTAAGGTSRGAYGDITGGFSSYGEANNNAVKLENLTGAALDSIYGGVSGINALPDKPLDCNQLTLNDLSQTCVSYTVRQQYRFCKRLECRGRGYLWRLCRKRWR